jgi:hypothetical protein
MLPCGRKVLDHIRRWFLVVDEVAGILKFILEENIDVIEESGRQLFLRDSCLEVVEISYWGVGAGPHLKVLPVTEAR